MEGAWGDSAAAGRLRAKQAARELITVVEARVGELTAITADVQTGLSRDASPRDLGVLAQRLREALNEMDHAAARLIILSHLRQRSAPTPRGPSAGPQSWPAMGERKPGRHAGDDDAD